MISLKYIFRNNFGNQTPISKVPRKYHTITLFIKKEKIGNFRTSTLFFFQPLGASNRAFRSICYS